MSVPMLQQLTQALSTYLSQNVCEETQNVLWNSFFPLFLNVFSSSLHKLQMYAHRKTPSASKPSLSSLPPLFAGGGGRGSFTELMQLPLHRVQAEASTSTGGRLLSHRVQEWVDAGESHPPTASSQKNMNTLRIYMLSVPKFKTKCLPEKCQQTPYVTEASFFFQALMKSAFMIIKKRML